MPFLKSLYFISCLTFLFAACSEAEDAVNQTCASNPSTLIEAETLWACQAVSSYEMDLTVSCNCMNYLPYHIVVKNNNQKDQSSDYAFICFICHICIDFSHCIC